LQCFYSFKRSSNNGNITVQGSTSSISSEGSLSKYHDMMHEIVEEIINEKKVKKSNIIEVKETFQMTSGVQKKLDKQLHIEKIF